MHLEKKEKGNNGKKPKISSLISMSLMRKFISFFFFYIVTSLIDEENIKHRLFVFRYTIGLYNFFFFFFDDHKPFIEVSNILIYITFTNIQLFEDK